MIARNDTSNLEIEAITFNTEVSVIIPNLNRKPELLKAIDSVLNQTFKVLEIIIVDDGSNFSNKEFLEANGITSKLIRVIKNQFNKGLSYSRNRGISEAKGDLIAFLDSDDYWEPKKIEKQVELFQADPSLDMAYCDTFLIINGLKIKRITQFYSKNLWEQFIKGWKPPNPSTLMIRKNSFEKNGLFSEDLRHHEDFDFWLRAADRLKIGYCTDILSNFSFDSKDRLSNEYKLKFKRTYEFLEKWEAEIIEREGKEVFHTFKKELLSDMAIETFNMSFKNNKFNNIISVYFKYLITDIRFYNLLICKFQKNMRTIYKH